VPRTQIVELDGLVPQLAGELETRARSDVPIRIPERPVLVPSHQFGITVQHEAHTAQRVLAIEVLFAAGRHFPDNAQPIEVSGDVFPVAHFQDVGQPHRIERVLDGPSGPCPWQNSAFERHRWPAHIVGVDNAGSTVGPGPAVFKGSDEDGTCVLVGAGAVGVTPVSFARIET